MQPVTYVPTYEGLCLCQQWDMDELAASVEALDFGIFKVQPKEKYVLLARISRLKLQIRERSEKLDRLARIGEMVIANQDIPVQLSRLPRFPGDIPF